MSMIKESMLSSQERESETRKEMQEFAEKSLSMHPAAFSKSLDGFSDKETKCLIEIYDGYRSDPSKKSQEFTVALNATLASQKRYVEASDIFFDRQPPKELIVYTTVGAYTFPSDIFPKKHDWIEWGKEHREAPAKTEQEWEEAYEREKASFEIARDNFNNVMKKNSEIETHMRQVFGELAPQDRLQVLESLSKAVSDMRDREVSFDFNNVSKRRSHLGNVFNDLAIDHAERMSQTEDDEEKIQLNKSFDILIRDHAKRIGEKEDNVRKNLEHLDLLRHGDRPSETEKQSFSVKDLAEASKRDSAERDSAERGATHKPKLKTI